MFANNVVSVSNPISGPQQDHHQSLVQHKIDHELYQTFAKGAKSLHLLEIVHHDSLPSFQSIS